MHRFDPSPWEEKAGRPLRVWGYPGLQDNQSYTGKLSQKSKTKDAPDKYDSSLLKMSSFHNLRPTASNVGFLSWRNVNSAERDSFSLRPAVFKWWSQDPFSLRELGAQPRKLLLSRLYSLTLIIWKIKAVHFKITSLTYFRENKFWEEQHDTVLQSLYIWLNGSQLGFLATSVLSIMWSEKREGFSHNGSFWKAI